MIIACPECSNPFEIEAHRIAPLVQVVCPHCTFQMILDFEAANNPALVEEGMKMASGWRSASDYRTATTAPARPALAPVPEPEPEPEPQPQVAARAVPSTPARAPVASPPTPRMPTADPDEPPTQPVAPARPAAAASEEQTKIVETPAASSRAHLQVQLDDSMEEEDQPTMIRTDLRPTPISRPAPEPEEPPTTPMSMRRPAAKPTPAKPTPAIVPPADFDDKPTSISTPDSRLPPHSPATPSTPDRGGTVVGPAPSRPPVEAKPRREPVAEPDAPTKAETARPQPRFETFDEPALDEAPKSSAFASVMVALLLLLTLGLVGASLALEGTPDPRPLLEDLYRQYLK